jgi:ABC-type Fe3+ transport system substrate-binding protein
MGPPKGDVKAFIDFMLSPAGQAFVAKDFVAVRKSR